MIFITDLDRTLIYSPLFLQEAGCNYQLVEKKGERPIAYMSTEGIRLLEAVHQRIPIIPMTLRNEKEFHRIALFRERVIPELFVTNNGGTIYYHGKEDMRWSNWIREQLGALTLSGQQIKAAFEGCYQSEIEKVVDCGGLVWLFMGRQDQLDLQGIATFKEQFASSGWCIDRSGRKIYVYPWFVTKWQAARYIQKTYFPGKIVAAGDSVFDQEMVEQADYGIIPKACYIEEQIAPHVKITSRPGMRAAEDLLAYVLEIVEREQL